MDFASLAKTLNLQEHSGLLTQAQQLWNMLDDMAASDPTAYDAFIAKQMQEKERLQKELAPPQPEFGLNAYKGSKVCFGVNISSSTRVKEPQPNSSEVPISLNPAFTFSKGAANSMEVYEAIYHPKLFEKARLDSTFKREIASVGLETVCKKFKISADNFEITEPFAKETPSSTDPTAAPPMPPSPLSAKELLAQLKDETLHERESPLPPLRPDTTPSKAAPLIQEISSPTVPTLSLAKPQYTMKNEKGLITLTVHLPDVQSIAEMDLDISEHDISLLAPEKYSLEVSFPCTVDDASVTAAFNKQFKMLEVTVRVRV